MSRGGGGGAGGGGGGGGGLQINPNPSATCPAHPTAPGNRLEAPLDQSEVMTFRRELHLKRRLKFAFGQI